jgi:predicted membrane-bound spermidine synthase
VNRLSGNIYSFFFALCSLAYEFIFIKAATAIQGGQVFKYNLTVSLFTFSLGVGSLLSQKFLNKKPLSILFRIELALFAAGLLGPIFILMSHSMILCNIFIILVGVLSGFELPLLFKLNEDRDHEVLAWDYIGMFLASIVIPLFFLRTIGLGATTILISCLNLTFAFSLVRNKKSIKWLTPVPIIIGILLSFYHLEINEFLSDLYLQKVL